MFTGLVRYLDRVAAIRPGQLVIQSAIKNPTLGESIAVNGVCLTVSQKKRTGKNWLLAFDVSPETYRRTNLGALKAKSPVNVEQCLTLRDLLGGHLVQGHVDGVGTVKAIRKLKDNKEIWFSGPKSVLRYVVPKGSVAVNGVSLTAVEVRGDRFSVALIPHTLRHTNLGNLKTGDRVNLEADIIAKYVERFTQNR